MVVATGPQPYEAPLRPQLTGTTVATTGDAIDRRRLGGCHDPSPKNDGCGACSHSYSLHRPWANTAASRPYNAAATNPNHRDPGGPMTGAGRAVTGDGMVSAGFGSGRNGDCSSSSASAPISVSALTGTTFATTGAGRSDCRRRASGSSVPILWFGMDFQGAAGTEQAALQARQHRRALQLARRQQHGQGVCGKAQSVPISRRDSGRSKAVRKTGPHRAAVRRPHSSPANPFTR